MTKPQFLAELTKQLFEVVFDVSRLSGSTDVVANVLADVLGRCIPEGDVIRFGVETSSFGENWSGQLTWLLALSRQLLELSAEVEKAPRTGDARAFKVALHIPALIGETTGSPQLELRYEGGMKLTLRDARLTPQDGREVSGRRIKEDGFCRFFAELLAARSNL
jgi:hypothetical protein